MAANTGRTDQSAGEEMGSNRSMLILYGSETGHGEEISGEIGEIAERLRFETSVEEMNDVSLKELNQHTLAVFVTSTTGQGDVPANANTFWKSLLRKKLPPTCLNQLRFTIFGLGDSSYPKFNWAARKLQKRLLQLGAVEAYPSGEGDERHDNGIDSIYLPWFEGFKTYLSTELPLPSGMVPLPDDELLPPKYPISVEEMRSEDPAVKAARYEANRTKHAALSHISSAKTDDSERDDRDARHNDLLGSGQFARAGGVVSDRLTRGGLVQLDKDNILKDHAANYDLLKFNMKEKSPPYAFLPIPCTWDSVLLANRRVTPEDHWQDVRLLKIEIMKTDWNDNIPLLQPGDNAIIYPKNFLPDVQKLIDMMGWDSIADRAIIWNNRGRPKCPRNMFLADNATLRDVLHHNLDINAVPNRTFLKQLQRHTKDEREKERLLELTQESNTQEFYDYTSRPRRTILEVLEDFPGVKIPMEYALEIFPIIRGRAFSIANHAPDHRDKAASSLTINILVALVEYKTIIRKPRQGLCSRYIKALREDTDLIIGLKRNPQPPPFGAANSRRPLIAVATGTGIAPIMSLIQERHMWKSLAPAPALLFFGCRNRDADFHFKDEFHCFENLNVIPAFSRDPISQDDKCSLDPYASQEKSLVKPEIELSTDPAPIGPHNTPWVRSFDYDRGKMYVQHLIRKRAKDICLTVKHAQKAGLEPIFMICGNAGRMPISVRHALEDALVIGGLVKDNEAAKAYLQSVGIWMETW